ncbi:glycoside hydrolase family 13 protein [Psychroserpens sp.]|uniref:glycoside hydrolase family 13 protein n=1 Tax=Psychroserpens sp. TaxID=2020870 RepID=UPI001B10B158|nr:glycoside hydrolase family 13 protein [Psychroserpens sp.]MBO6605740.1 glycoside hydrolase family 13 protein [Psychroserpens sp.]MBO6652889.1 glycoside hydrolase family 13 protein [Psychroserpens sp.]MBO6681339.1 glycoside hydrolase family 13 protein [Psychroserpens sp.]MBO6749114.1 glycoside hydrolase family 13 protein [Psychroserpens sp.]MBO6914440.1 glycoside hydrolase family 13 protein [Psychroserpens sp.]
MKKLILIAFLCFAFACKENTSNDNNDASNTVEFIDKHEIERVEPPNWWIGFENDSLQLLVKHEEIANYSASIDYPGISIESTNKGDNSNNYLFIDLTIANNTKAGRFNISFKDDSGDELIATYELKDRTKSAEDYVGFDSSDAIFLITPDRFANANTKNDIPLPLDDNGQLLLEQTIDRSNDYARHGGDIQGIIEHLDYISDLGFTAVWPQPMLTNDMPQGSYHGYAITDLYQIDPRFGTNEQYLELSLKLKDRGMKLVMDQVANHCGLEHWWMRDFPFKDWVNLQDNFESNIDNWNNESTIYSNHRRTTNQDIYASDYDSNLNSDGWFVAAMPDLNQRNPYMAKYIIQNSIWWIETAQLDGIRQDTYPYPDKDFMSDWAGAIMTEYPNFSIVGEEWSYNPLLIGYWQEGANNRDGYDSNLKSSMDFAMQRKVVEALNEPESWDKGLVKIYEGLANDFHYASPKDIMVFPDNHDMSRIFTQLNGDIPNTKMALATYAMMPRILQMYYGTEILMNDFEKPGDHGLIRTDFPGGWEGDTVNGFTGEGLTDEQKDMQSFMTKLLNYRKDSRAIHEGGTTHFAPHNGTYTLFRTLEDETVVLILSKSDAATSLDLNRFKEMGLNGKMMKNIITGETTEWNNTIELTTRGVTLLTTKLN